MAEEGYASSPGFTPCPVVVRLKYPGPDSAAMAKEKRSAADLDAELAALEAELAALEGKKKAAKAPKKAEAPKPAPAGEPAATPAPQKKGRFSLPLPKKGKKEAPTPAPVDEASAAPEPVEAERSPAEATPPLPPPTLAAATYDLSLWRQEGDAWVRVVPDTPVASVRRVLDEEGNVVREEPVEAREIESTSAVKAERGLGRFLRRK